MSNKVPSNKIFLLKLPSQKFRVLPRFIFQTKQIISAPNAVTSNFVSYKGNFLAA